jgi:hypothetical protein
MILNYDHTCSFIALATVITIVNYDRKTFIVQATGRNSVVFENITLWQKIMQIYRFPEYRVL